MRRSTEELMRRSTEELMRRSTEELMRGALVVLALIIGCKREAPVVDPQDAVLRDLEQLETARRASIDWATHPPSDRALGPDPIDLVALPSGRVVVALRGTDEVMLADENGQEIARAKAPRKPRAVAYANGRVFVVGELSPDVLELSEDLKPLRTTSGTAKGHRGIAVRDGHVLTLGIDGVLRRQQAFALPTGQARPTGHVPPTGPTGQVKPTGQALVEAEREDNIGAFAVGVQATKGALVSMSVVDHRVVILRGDTRHELRNDGPFWGFAVREVGDDLLVAAGHVEDHPLERKDGSFAYIDSFVRVVRVSGERIENVAIVNTSEHGVVTPKGMVFVDDNTLVVTGAGSPTLARIDISADAPVISTQPWLPGSSALVSTTKLIATSPLLDALIVDGVAVPIAHTPRSEESRLGEALMFTHAMAPRQKSDGKLSRFTCEACHFEGTIDGRTHRTGRGDIVATTRPLWGLANNIPLFTRALDPNLTEMVHAEFRVANANSGLDPWFALTPKDAPWLLSSTKTPADLRRAFVEFLFDFSPPSAFPCEMKGADVFRARCASCHAPRLVGSDPSSEVPFDKWSSDGARLVWSSPEKRKTGVVPYVHEDGARSSSLRRIAMKKPYFTTGFATTLDEVLDAVRIDGEELLHFSDRGERLSDDEKQQLRAFLECL